MHPLAPGHHVHSISGKLKQIAWYTFFIIWNNSIIDSALIIIYHEYYVYLRKPKIKAHLSQANNLTYLFHLKTWSLITSQS